MFKRIAPLLVASLFAACGGGGGDAGTSPFGGGAPTTPAASTTADVILAVSSAQLDNVGTARVSITATAIDAARNTIASVPITLAADSGAVLSALSGAKTGTDGAVTATLSAGESRANRLITVTAVSGAITKSTTVQVVGTTVAATLVPAVIAPSAAGKVQYRVVDKAGNVMANESLKIVATGLTPAEVTGVTGANGDFSYDYTAPATAGTYGVTIVVGGKTDQQNLVVQQSSSVPAVATTIASASVSANPSVVSANSNGATNNRGEIRALFLGANNLPVKNVRVRFDLDGDPNSIGGTFTTGTTTLYSDANGIVSTSYIPGSRSSPTDGVRVRVCYGTTDTDPNLVNCATSKVVTLTVTAEPLGVTIGTNGVIIVNTLTYVKEFVISVSDAAGVAKPDVNLVASVDLPVYRKGSYRVVNGKWAKVGALPSGDNAICANEDKNRNGVLEDGEDKNDPSGNGNGDNQLWPRKPDVTVTLLQSKTGADGTAVLQIQYAQDHGSWVDALITVAASGVSGSEGRASYLVSPVPIDSGAIGNTSSSPAFQISPYGLATSCSNPN
jgi:hypothetical protein